MRLLHVEDDGELSLAEFIEDDIPRYAILSHTWGLDSDEVSYQDLVNGTGKEKRGHRKIDFCAKQAREDGLEYFWVDTCCSAELTESINSMFQWYEIAEVCYVLLEDLDAGPDEAPGQELQHCRWFTRGWTLQELLAPVHVKFYNKSWSFIGAKQDLAGNVASFTTIPLAVLLSPQKISSVCIASKMSWAAHRKTKRKEDEAYCMLGLFDVNMPLIYGEGSKAFQRLQEEIVKRNNDLTILAWEPMPSLWDTALEKRLTTDRFIGCFAQSAANFTESSKVLPFPDMFVEFSTTNKGLFIASDITLRTASLNCAQDEFRRVYFIYLGINGRERKAIYLRKLGPRLYCRLNARSMRSAPNADGHHVRGIHILLDAKVAQTKIPQFYRSRTLHVPPSGPIKVQMALPTAQWDYTDAIFLGARTSGLNIHPVVLALRLVVTVDEGLIPVTLLCDYRSETPTLGILEHNSQFAQSHLIFQYRYEETGVPWDLLGPIPWSLKPDMIVDRRGEGGACFKVSFGLEVEFLQVLGQQFHMKTHSITVSVVRLSEEKTLNNQLKNFVSSLASSSKVSEV